MIKISTQINFCAGHRLKDYKGLCSNLHGHNYVARIVADRRNSLDALGMVVDFKRIKEPLKKWIDENWDHGMILNEEDFECVAFCKAQGYKVFVAPGNPTAEFMSFYLKHLADEMFARQEFRISEVTVEETPGCSATTGD